MAFSSLNFQFGYAQDSWYTCFKFYITVLRLNMMKVTLHQILYLGIVTTINTILFQLKQKGCKHMHSYNYNSLKKDLEEKGLPYFEGRHIFYFMPKIKVHGHRKQSEIVVYPITQLLNHS